MTERGGILSRLAIVAREYSVPATLGTLNATERIPNGARGIVVID